jgi:hypothetical protein
MASRHASISSEEVSTGIRKTSRLCERCLLSSLRHERTSLPSSQSRKLLRPRSKENSQNRAALVAALQTRPWNAFPLGPGGHFGNMCTPVDLQHDQWQGVLQEQHFLPLRCVHVGADLTACTTQVRRFCEGQLAEGVRCGHPDCDTTDTVCRQLLRLDVTVDLYRIGGLLQTNGRAGLRGQLRQPRLRR